VAAGPIKWGKGVPAGEGENDNVARKKRGHKNWKREKVVTEVDAGWGRDKGNIEGRGRTIPCGRINERAL